MIIFLMFSCSSFNNTDFIYPESRPFSNIPSTMPSPIELETKFLTMQNEIIRQEIQIELLKLKTDILIEILESYKQQKFFTENKRKI